METPLYAFRPEDSRVLVIDDSAGLRTLIGRILDVAGYREVTFAVDGEDGLAKVAEVGPDLILLDIMMPKLDGWGFLERLRADEAHATTPVLVQTALDDPEQRARAFKLGATDLVTKPINAPELISRVRIHLENRGLIRSLSAYRRRMEQEMTLAQGMQHGLIPTPARLDELGTRLGLRLAGHFEASESIGGDLWGVTDFDEARLGLWMVDFAGHGVGAALNTFRLHTLMAELACDPDDPAALLGALNARLKALLPVEQYATMLNVVVDLEARRLRWAAAGATAPLIVRPGDDGPTALDSSGLPLGIVAQARHETRETAFPPGSHLLLYSDALTETVRADGGPWGEDGAAAAFAEAVAGDTPPLAALMARFEDGLAHRPEDDLSAVHLHWPV